MFIKIERNNYGEYRKIEDGLEYDIFYGNQVFPAMSDIENWIPVDDETFNQIMSEYEKIEHRF